MVLQSPRAYHPAGSPLSPGLMICFRRETLYASVQKAARLWLADTLSARARVEFCDAVDLFLNHIEQCKLCRQETRTHGDLDAVINPEVEETRQAE